MNILFNKVNYLSFNLIRSTFISLLYKLKIIKKRNLLPPLVGWDITFKCDGKCLYCYKKQNTNKEELSLKEKIKLIKTLGKLKTPVLTIGGGEPSLLKEFSVIVDEIKKQNIKLNIDTNGLNIIKEKESFLKANSITISLDSTKKDIFKKIRGYSLKKVEENIQRILLIRAWNSKPKINIRMTINALNYKEILLFYNKWKDIVDEIQYQPIHKDSDVFFKNIPGKIDPNIIKKQFQKLAKINKTYQNQHYQNMYLFFQDKKKLKQLSNKCQSYFFFIDIDPFGNIYNCGGHKIKIGNIRKTRLKKIINQNNLYRIKKINKNCFCYYDCAILNRYLKFI